MKNRVLFFTAFFAVNFMSFSQNIIAPFSLSDQFHFYNGAAPESNWTRGVIANNLNWNNTTKRWERTTAHTDFSMVRFANGNLSFIQGVDWSGNITSFSNQEIEESWTRLKINHDGNVGIGVNIPSAKLHVDGEIWSNGGLRLFKGDDSRDVRFGLDGNGYMHMEYGGGGVGAYIDLKVNKASDYDARMLVSDAGYFHITGLPVFIRNSKTSAISNGFALSVAGKIRAFEIKIYVGEWADYVFDTDYKLLSLEETEAYINENKHLPGIPSAQEIEENEGVELGEMQKLQMAKIEELTLYMIAMKKELDQLKKENELLKAAVLK